MKVAEAGSESLEESEKISIPVEYQVYELMAVLEGRERRCESEGTQGKIVVQICMHTSEPGASSTKAVGTWCFLRTESHLGDLCAGSDSFLAGGVSWETL